MQTHFCKSAPDTGGPLIEGRNAAFWHQLHVYSGLSNHWECVFI